MKFYNHYKLAVKDLFENGYKELWVVHAFTENDVAGREVFSIYRSEEEAKNYIKRIRNSYKISPFHEFIEDCGNDSFTFKDRGCDIVMLQHFQLLHERAA